MTKQELLELLDELDDCSCGRTLVESGPCRTFELAWDRDGNHQVLAWWRRMVTREWTDEPVFVQKMKSAELMETLLDLLVRIEEYCHKGTLRIPEQLNTLDESQGLLEIKCSRGRIPFYEHGELFPSSRGTHGFYKNSARTPQGEIDRGLAIKRVDQERSTDGCHRK